MEFCDNMGHCFYFVAYALPNPPLEYGFVMLKNATIIYL